MADYLVAILMFGGIYAVRMGMDLLAVSWFGMALSVTLKRPGLAPALTVLFVLILPSMLSFCWMDVLVDIFFITWGASKMQQDLRRRAALQYVSRG